MRKPIQQYNTNIFNYTVAFKMIRYAVVLENGLLYELVGRLGVKKQKKKWKTCVANNFSPQLVLVEEKNRLRFRYKFNKM